MWTSAVGTSQVRQLGDWSYGNTMEHSNSKCSILCSMVFHHFTVHWFAHGLNGFKFQVSSIEM